MQRLAALIGIGLAAAGGCVLEEDNDACLDACTDIDDQGPGTPPALTLFLNRDGGVYRATETPVPESIPGQTTFIDAHVLGPDDPASNRSGIMRLHSVAVNGVIESELAPWPHSENDWQTVMGCVGAIFADFDVEITDVEPPADTPYIEAAFAESARQWGTREHSFGEAPADTETCEPLHRAIVFVDVVGRWDRDIMQGICEDTAHEVGHVLGFDHDEGNDDSLMSGRPALQGRTFLDEDLDCIGGECHRCGSRTQNSHQLLLSTLGPARR